MPLGESVFVSVLAGCVHYCAHVVTGGGNDRGGHEVKRVENPLVGLSPRGEERHNNCCEGCDDSGKDRSHGGHRAPRSALCSRVGFLSDEKSVGYNGASRITRLLYYR